MECAKECEILSEVVEDQEAVKAVQRFLGECNPGRLSTATLSPASEAGWPGSDDVTGVSSSEEERS